MKNIKKIIAGLFIASLLVFNGCSGGGGSSSSDLVSSLSGLAQKGPFMQDSNVTLCKLDEKMDCTADILEAKVSDDSGSYEFEKLSWSGLSRLTISGFYFDEITGAKSSLPATISAIVNIQVQENQQQNVNLLTDLHAKRVKKLLDDDMDIEEAGNKAREEIKQIFNISSDDFSELNLLDFSLGKASVNVELLRISTAIARSSNPIGDLEELMKIYDEHGLAAVLASSLYKKLMSDVEDVNVEETLIKMGMSADEVQSIPDNDTALDPFVRASISTLDSSHVNLTLFATSFETTTPSISMLVDGDELSFEIFSISDDKKSIILDINESSACKDINITFSIDYLSLTGVELNPLESNLLEYRDPLTLCNPDTGTGEVLEIPENQNPIAIIGMDYGETEVDDVYITAYVGENVNGLETSYSHDRDPYPFGGISHCQWTDNSGSVIKEADNSFCDLYDKVFDIAGTYDYTLTVTDTSIGGATDTSVAHITVLANAIPTVSITPSSVEAIKINDVLTLNAIASDADSEDTISLQWMYTKKGSTTSYSAGSSSEFSHTFNEPGEYSVSVTVRDNHNATSEASITVLVEEVAEINVEFVDLVGVEIQQFFNSSIVVNWLADGESAAISSSGYAGSTEYSGFRVNGADGVTEVQNDDIVTVWHKSSNSYATKLSTTVTVGENSDTFSTTTKASESTKLPLIVGAPGTSANVSEYYSYAPQLSTDYTQFAPATQPFSIVNKPLWANFNHATGTLSGTPTTAGEFQNIKITAYGDDGLDDITFTITVRNDGPYINGTGHSLENADLSFTFSENSDWRSNVTEVELTSCYSQTTPAILSASDYTFSEGSLKLHVSSSTNVALHIPTMGGGQLTVKATGYGDSTGTVDYIADGQYGVKATATTVDTITEENLDTMLITLTLSNYLKFTDATLDTSNFTFYSSPDGVTLSSIAYVSDTVAELTLAFDGSDFDENQEIQINISENELNICQDVTANVLSVTAIDEPIWSNLLYPSDPVEDAHFGVAVDIKNETVAVSADTGVYIYTKDALGNYQQVQKIADLEAEDLALDGDYLVVGNGNFPVDGNGLEGRVKVYKKDAGGTYHLLADIAKPTLTVSAHFGAAVDMSGNLLLIGANNDDDHKGAAYLYKKDGSDNFTLVETMKRDSGKSQDYFGFDVAIDGVYFVVGSQVYSDLAATPVDNKTELGAGFVNYYNYLSDTLELMRVISPNDSGVLADHFGQSVAISGDHIAIGAPGNDSKGSVYLYKRAFDTATDNGKILGEIADESFGSSVGIYHNVSNTIVVGTAIKANAYSVVQGSSTSFTKYKSTLAGNDRLGYRVAIDANEVAFGLFANDDKASDGGAVLVTNVGETIIQGDDSLVNQFTFSDVTDAELSSVVESSITILGINQIVGISIVNGEYSLDNRTTWSDSNATVENEQVVFVRHTSAAEYNTSVATTLNVGDVSATFNSRTKLEEAPDLTGTVSVGSLMWEDTIHTRDSASKQMWSDANAYCAGLVLADFDDWRLPNFNWASELNEMGTIMSDSNSSATEDDRVINEPFVLITPANDIWSWTNEAQGESEHVVGIFTGGSTNFDGMTNGSELNVRCVRDITE